MFVYEKMLQYPVRVKTPNPRLAKVIMTQYGGSNLFAQISIFIRHNVLYFATFIAN